MCRLGRALPCLWELEYPWAEKLPYPPESESLWLSWPGLAYLLGDQKARGSGYPSREEARCPSPWAWKSRKQEELSYPSVSVQGRETWARESPSEWLWACLIMVR